MSHAKTHGGMVRRFGVCAALVGLIGGLIGAQAVAVAAPADSDPVDGVSATFAVVTDDGIRLQDMTLPSGSTFTYFLNIACSDSDNECAIDEVRMPLKAVYPSDNDDYLAEAPSILDWGWAVSSSRCSTTCGVCSTSRNKSC